jgi:hypothetical protein
MGSGVGIWIVTRHLIRHLEAAEEKLKNGVTEKRINGSEKK